MEDYTEARKGWYVEAYGARVYSDPTSAGDYDGDNRNDKQERLLGTDPRAADTDGDGNLDGASNDGAGDGPPGDDR
jgi:hypothetical protein